MSLRFRMFVKESMDSKNKGRIQYFDLAKGLLILLLLVHHFGSATRNAGLENQYFGLVTSWQAVFTAFFMQCFFVVSGYCSGFDREPVVFLKKVLRQLIVPWIVFELLQSAFWAVYYNDFSLQRLKSYLFTEPCTTLWFLNALAFSKVVVYLLKRFLKDEAVLAVTFVFLILAIVVNQANIGPNYLCIRESFGSCFFVALGSYLKRNTVLYEKLMKFSPFIYLPVLAALFILKVPIPAFTAGMEVSVFQFPLFLVLSISGTFAFLLLCKYLNSNRFLEFFGRGTLSVYGLHYCPLFAFVVLFYKLFTPASLGGFIVFLLAVFVSEILTCAVLVKLFQIKYLRWITGK